MHSTNANMHDQVAIVDGADRHRSPERGERLDHVSIRRPERLKPAPREERTSAPFPVDRAGKSSRSAFIRLHRFRPATRPRALPPREAIELHPHVLGGRPIDRHQRHAPGAGTMSRICAPPRRDRCRYRNGFCRRQNPPKERCRGHVLVRPFTVDRNERGTILAATPLCRSAASSTGRRRRRLCPRSDAVSAASRHAMVTCIARLHPTPGIVPLPGSRACLPARHPRHIPIARGRR